MWSVQETAWSGVGLDHRIYGTRAGNISGKMTDSRAHVFDLKKLNK